MIFLTYLISGLFFPSLIVYMPLPGDKFHDYKEHIITRITLTAMINIGSYLVFNSIGSLFNVYCYQKSNKEMIRTKFCIILVLIELVSCIYIIYFAIA